MATNAQGRASVNITANEIGGTYTVTAYIGDSALASFSLTNTQPPAITSSNTSTLNVGQNGSFIVTTSGFPKPTLTEFGDLPSGVTFVDNGNGTATLGGVPSAGTSGTYNFIITAHNGAGSDAVQNFTLNVNPAPMPPLAPPPSPPASPKVPSLLGLFNRFLGGLETVSSNGTTITDNLFGLPLVERYDQSGNLVSVTLLGFNLTFLFG